MDDPQISQHTPARSDAPVPVPPGRGRFARWLASVTRLLAGRG